VLSGLGRFLSGAGAASGRGARLRLEADRDAIPALAPEREALWARLDAASFLTPNEKRAAVGLEPVAGGDDLPPASAPFGGGPGGAGDEGGAPRPFERRGRTAPAREVKGRAVRASRAARFAELTRDHEAARAAGHTHKIWRTVGDGDVRSSHAGMDGVRVDIDEAFTVGGERLFLPSDPDAAFDETANCRCFVEYVTDDAGADGEDEEEPFGDIRSVEVARRIARLREKYGVGLNDALRGYTPEQRAAKFGRKLSESEVLRNLEDFEAELDRTRALGAARGKDWTLERLQRVRTNLGDREPKGPDDVNRLGAVNARGKFGAFTEQTIVLKPELSEEEVRELAAGDEVFVATMFGRESERTPAAAKRYVIRHELGHALQNAKGPFSPEILKLSGSARRKLSIRAGKGIDEGPRNDFNELVAELIAWYTSPDYDGGLDAEVEAALDDLLR